MRRSHPQTLAASPMALPWAARRWRTNSSSPSAIQAANHSLPVCPGSWLRGGAEGVGCSSTSSVLSAAASACEDAPSTGLNGEAVGKGA